MPTFPCCARHTNVEAEVVETPARRGKLEEPDSFEAAGGLLEAAKNNNVERVNSLLRARADINAIEDEATSDSACIGASALVLACRAGHADVARRLLQEPSLDTEVTTDDLTNKSRCNQTAFLWACRTGHAAVVKALAADPRVNVNAKTSFNLPGFFLACQGDHDTVVKLLLKNPACDTKFTWHPPNDESTEFTGLVLAVYEGACKVIKVIVEVGGWEVSKPMRLFGDTVTFLTLAAKSNFVHVARAFLDAKADPDIPDGNGKTPFEHAFKNNYKEIMMNLLLAGCDTSTCLTDVKHAQVVGEISELRSLIASDKVTEDDCFPELHSAAIHGDTSAVSALLKKMPDPRAAKHIHDGGHMPAAFYAIELAHRPAARLLLQQAHELDECIVNDVLASVKGDEGSEPREPGERTFAAINSMITRGSTVDKRHAKGAEAFLKPWMGSVVALKYLKPRPEEFDALRELCRQKSQAIYTKIDGQVGAEVLSTLAKIDVESVTDNLRQDSPGLLPELFYYINEERKQVMGGDREVYYAMSLALLAQALDKMFQQDVAETFASTACTVHSAPPKSFGRMFNKLMNLADHGDTSIKKPRPAKNVDIIRAGIEVSDWEEMRRVLDALSERYQILRVKNSHNPNEGGFGGYRSLLVNFAYKPGVKLADLFGNEGFHDMNKGAERGFIAEDPAGKAWLDYCKNLPQSLSWCWGLCGLWTAARQHPEQEVTMSAEVQIIYSPYMVGRSLSHLLFKISRCETGPEEMVRDFAADLSSENAKGKEERRRAAQGLDRLVLERSNGKRRTAETEELLKVDKNARNESEAGKTETATPRKQGWKGIFKR